MAERSYPWAGTLLGDCGRYTMDTYGAFLLSLLGDSAENVDRAPFPGRQNELQVVPTGPASMNVMVEEGAGFVGNRVYENTAQVTFAITANTSGLVRYDRVILRRRKPEQTVRLALLVGLPGAGIPACTNIYGVQSEVPLATITVASGAAAINAADITDDRQFWHDRRLWLGSGDWAPDATDPGNFVQVPHVAGLWGWQFMTIADNTITASVLIPPEWGDTPITLYPWAWVLHEDEPLAYPHAFTLALSARTYGNPSVPANLTAIGTPSATNTDLVVERRYVSGGALLTTRPGEIIDLAFSTASLMGGYLEYFFGLELVARR